MTVSGIAGDHMIGSSGNVMTPMRAATFQVTKCGGHQGIEAATATWACKFHLSGKLRQCIRNDINVCCHVSSIGVTVVYVIM